LFAFATNIIIIVFCNIDLGMVERNMAYGCVSSFESHSKFLFRESNVVYFAFQLLVCSVSGSATADSNMYKLSLVSLPKLDADDDMIFFQAAKLASSHAAAAAVINGTSASASPPVAAAAATPSVTPPTITIIPPPTTGPAGATGAAGASGAFGMYSI
jgi:hypothetical protein